MWAEPVEARECAPSTSSERIILSRKSGRRTAIDLEEEGTEPGTLIREVGGGPSHVVVDSVGVRSVARSDGVNDGLVARDVHVPNGTFDSGEHDRHPDGPFEGFPEVCTNVSLPVSRHSPRWKLRSASILLRDPCRPVHSLMVWRRLRNSARLLRHSIRPLRQRSCGHGLKGRTYGVDVTDLFGAEVADVQASRDAPAVSRPSCWSCRMLRGACRG